jgi:double-stranded uracil-DNA glycosylase
MYYISSSICSRGCAVASVVMTHRPSRSELDAANGRSIPDVAAPGLRVLFCGINPGLWSAATGHHFARPGNRFWPALHRGGFTATQLSPADQHQLLGLGLGITNLVARSSARADELTATELRAGGEVLAAKLREMRPRWLAVLGVTAYRVAFDRGRAVVGRQADPVGETAVWILPNPSGLNAHYTIDALAAEFTALRQAVRS